MGYGGLIVNQRIQIKTCMRVKANTLSLCWVGPNHFITLLPGNVALKAISTTIVFPRTQEIQRTKVIPKVVWRSIQDQSEGRPMKVREHRKHSFKERSSRKLSSELLALTIGVSLWTKKIMNIKIDKNTPKQQNTDNTIPMISVKERNSVGFGMHLSFFSFGQNSTVHKKQSDESGRELIPNLIC